MFDLSFLLASPFYQLTLLLVLAAAIGLLGMQLRQPTIVSFIIVGILAGPSALNLIQAEGNVDLMAELGIAVLLFLVGLKLDLHLIRTLGPVAVATGLGQVAFTSLFGFFLALLLGLDAISAIYVSIALTFSSTIIVVKLLTDRREADSLHGRIAIGLLIVQDLVVILAMMILGSFGSGGEVEAESNVVLPLLRMLMNGLGALVFISVFIRYLATPLVRRVAHSPDLLVIFAISWAALLATAGDLLGFSKELGGLVAGISLASTPFREAIIARLASLRDFLLLFFFIALGAQLDLTLLSTQLIPALVFSVFVLIGKPLIMMVIMGVMGYRKRTSFLAGLTIAQISEFSLILVAMGVSLDHVTNESLGLVTLAGMITITLSVYMISYSQQLYRWLEPLLGVFERKVPYREENLELQGDTDQRYDVILFGLGRYGKGIVNYLQQYKSKILAIDFNPDEVKISQHKDLTIAYGDASDQEFISSLPLKDVKWVICALPQHDTGVTHDDPRLTLLDALKRQGFTGKIAVSTHHLHDGPLLTERGADLVLCPFVDAAERAVARIVEFSP